MERICFQKGGDKKFTDKNIPFFSLSNIICLSYNKYGKGIGNGPI